jgi:hypothetical protein
MKPMTSAQRVGCLYALLVMFSSSVTTAQAQDVAELLTTPAVSFDAGIPAPAAASDQSISRGTTDDHMTAPGRKGDRMFGVLPNRSTVEGGQAIGPITPRQMFATTALNSFDPYVFPFVGVVTALGQGGRSGYTERYATSLADNAIGNFLTSAALPSALHQDPRYFELGEGGFLHRAGYALSRSVVTHSRSGRTEFNYSEIAGNALAAGLSNAYYAPSARTVTDTLTRWGMQLLWDTVSNELKEFWPDVRQKLRK